MIKELIYKIPSIYRDDFCINGYKFGSGEKSLCIVGSTRGNEYQQIYTCSRLVYTMKKLEACGRLNSQKEVLIIPSLNPSSMNIEKRFWPTDNTDINRMFPGYALGETTQRIAAGVFEKISDYENGIQFTSFYMPGKFCPHVRMMKSGYENVEKARLFGLPYIVLKHPKPYDTTTLNYNWQLWETDAFSVYGRSTDELDEESAWEIINSIVRFMTAIGIVKDADNGLKDGEDVKCSYNMDSAGAYCGKPAAEGTESHVFMDRELLSVRPKCSGIYKSIVNVQDKVVKGQILAYVFDACEGDILEELRAPADGTIFFAHSKPLVYADTAVMKLLPG